MLVTICVGHVEHSDHRVVGCLLGWLVGIHQCWGVLVSVLVVCHGGDGEVWLNVVGGHVEVELVPLVDNVVVILGMVVVSWGVVVIANVISVFMLGTVRSAHSFPVDAFQYVLVGLGFVRLVVFCVFKENLVHIS